MAEVRFGFAARVKPLVAIRPGSPSLGLAVAYGRVKKEVHAFGPYVTF